METLDWFSHRKRYCETSVRIVDDKALVVRIKKNITFSDVDMVGAECSVGLTEFEICDQRW